MLEDLKDLGVSSDRIVSAGLPCLDLLPGFSDMDPDWFRTQQEEVHKCLDAMLKQPRWRLGELMRDLWNDRVPSVKLGFF